MLTRLIAALGLLAATAAVADDARTFGSRGHLVPAGGFGLSLSSDASGNDLKVFSASIAPSVLYFFADRWAAGGQVILNVAHVPDAGWTTAYGGGPVLAHAAPLSPAWSLFPQARFYLYRFETIGFTVPSSGPPIAYRTHLVQAVGNVYAPVLFHPVQHFFVGFGPALSVSTSAYAAFVGPAQIRIGLDSTIGGHF